MSPHRIEVYPAVRQTLLNLTKPARRRLQHTIDGLAEQPRPPDATELSGAPGNLRLRAGTHDLIYVAREDAILIVDLAHRSSPWQQSHINNTNNPDAKPLTEHGHTPEVGDQPDRG